MFIVRLTNGDCVVTTASDERIAGIVALKLCLDPSAEIATIRALDSFAVQLTPTDDGSLEAAHWDDATLESILAHEYPLLREAYNRANAEPLMLAAKAGATQNGSAKDASAMSQLHAAYQRNLETIREGLGRELQRHAQAPVASQSANKANATRT
jgi:hypothetical protein